MGRHRRGLALLLLAAFAFDLLRALTVPAGLWNIDEAYHFVDVLNTARFLRYDTRRAFGSLEQPPTVLPGGTIDDPRLIFHPPGWLPVRGTAYLLLQAIPQLLMGGATDAARLLVARIVSALLHMAVIGLTYRIARRLFPAAGWLPLASAALAAFVPSYSDMMSGVNPDVGAAAAGTLFIYGLTELLRQGPRRGAIGLLVLAAALGTTAKETFWALLPVAAFAFWLLARRRVKVGAAIAALSVAAGAVIWLQPLTGGGAAYWFAADWEYGHDASLAPRVATATPVGEYALRLSDAQMPKGAVQYLPESSLAALRGQIVTWGVWLRASEPATVTIAAEGDDGPRGSLRITIGTAWEFHAFRTTLDSRIQHLALHLGSPPGDAVVEYDGMIGALGEYPLDTPPQFSDSGAMRGEWGGRPFVNLLLNPSGETSWPQVKQAYDLRPWNLNTRLNALLAWRRTLPAFAGLGRWLLANYWSGFGGLLPGLSARQLIPFGLLSAWAGFGVATIALRDRQRRLGTWQDRTERRGVILLLAAALATWSIVLYRTDFVPNTANVLVWSVSRHAAAGLSATTILFALGFFRWLPARARRWALATLLIALFATNAWILLGVQIPFYHCASALPTDCLPTVH